MGIWVRRDKPDHNHHPLMDDDGGDGGVERQASGVHCSICLDFVTDNGGRSRAKLPCGHEFHLDCIGSAFNIKGEMQCPNCRKVEKGQWLYANGSTCLFPELSTDDWNLDEDPYELTYSEMPFRVHWCPFGELARIPTSFEDVESPSTTYHDMREHHSMPTENNDGSSLAHSYVAYFGPIPHASSRSSDSIDDPHFNYPWNGLSGHNEMFNAHTFPASGIQYHSWGHHSAPFSQFGTRINGTDPGSVPPATQGSTHRDSDTTTSSRSFPYPLLFPHRTGPRAGSSFVSSVVPRFPGPNAHPHEMIQVSHALPFPQRPGPSPIVPAVRRVEHPGVLPPMVVAPLQPERNGGFHIFPSQTSLHEAENSSPNQFHGWERERFSHFPPVLSDRDSAYGPFHQAAGESDSVNRSSTFCHRRWS